MREFREEWSELRIGERVGTFFNGKSDTSLVITLGEETTLESVNEFGEKSVTKDDSLFDDTLVYMKM